MHLSNNELANLIMLNMKIENDMRTYVSDRKGHDFRYSVDSNKISQIGFLPNKKFSDGLLETIEWYIDNPNWWD